MPVLHWLHRIAVNPPKISGVSNRKPPTDDIEIEDAEQFESAAPARQRPPTRLCAPTGTNGSRAVEELRGFRDAITFREVEGMSYTNRRGMQFPIGHRAFRIFRAAEAIDELMKPLLDTKNARVRTPSRQTQDTTLHAPPDPADSRSSCPRDGRRVAARDPFCCALNTTRAADAGNAGESRHVMRRAPATAAAGVRRSVAIALGKMAAVLRSCRQRRLRCAGGAAMAAPLAVVAFSSRQPGVNRCTAPAAAAACRRPAPGPRCQPFAPSPAAIPGRCERIAGRGGSPRDPRMRFARARHRTQPAPNQSRRPFFLGRLRSAPQPTSCPPCPFGAAAITLASAGGGFGDHARESAVNPFQSRRWPTIPPPSAAPAGARTRPPPIPGMPINCFSIPLPSVVR